VSAPLASYGVSNKSSFFWGAFSGFVEFLAAIVGFLFLSAVAAATPFALAFSSGAMIFVTFSELMPDALRTGDKRQVVLMFAFGAALAYSITLLLAILA
jgi:ZIP family zinc transporter